MNHAPAVQGKNTRNAVWTRRSHKSYDKFTEKSLVENYTIENSLKIGF